MKEDHRVQTPQKDALHANRRPKATPERSNPKHQKSHRKSLNSIFLPVFEDVAPESAKDSFDISSSLSEVSEEHQLTESPQSFTTSSSSVISPSLETPPSSGITLYSSSISSEAAKSCDSSVSQCGSLQPDYKEEDPFEAELLRFITPFSSVTSPSLETPLSSDITPFSSTNSSESAKPGDLSVNRCGSLQPNPKEADFFDVELLITHLKQSMIPILNSDGVDYRYKKLHDALMKIVIEEFYRMPQERGWSTKLSSRKYQVMFLIFMLWLLAIMLLYFMNIGVQRSFNGPPPT